MRIAKSSIDVEKTYDHDQPNSNINKGNGCKNTSINMYFCKTKKTFFCTSCKSCESNKRKKRKSSKQEYIRKKLKLTTEKIGKTKSKILREKLGKPFGKEEERYLISSWFANYGSSTSVISKIVYDLVKYGYFLKN